MCLESRQRLLTSRAPGGDWEEIKARWWRRRWWWSISLKNVMSNISLARLDLPVGVADIRVPNHRVHTKITGLHRGVPWAPVTWPRWVVIRPPAISARSAIRSSGHHAARYPHGA